jgi:hypothetical protein
VHGGVTPTMARFTSGTISMARLKFMIEMECIEGNAIQTLGSLLKAPTPLAMKMEHCVTAYDSESEELLAFVFSVPGAFMRRVREIARVAPTDLDAIGSYPLTKEEAYKIAKLLELPLEFDSKAVFFLEPIAQE